MWYLGRKIRQGPDGKKRGEIGMGYRASIRDKLIGIFILIKVIPLVVLAWFAWHEIASLSGSLEEHVNEMARTSAQTTGQVADLATSSSIRALDLRSREAIERLTTDTARSVAAFLMDRDVDIRAASLLTPDKEVYGNFLHAHQRAVTRHVPWVLNPEKDGWMPLNPQVEDERTVTADNRDNELDFHYRPPERAGFPETIPLYLEMSFVDLSGRETFKVTTSDLMPIELRDVSRKDQTFCRAETYFKDLQGLKPGEIYVSEVIGAYVKTHIIGTYGEKQAMEKGIAFAPEASGYAGKENPVGRRFRGLVRWAMPVTRQGAVIGYVTLALDHTHIMEFTDHIVPTDERYAGISDAGSGNYAFIWDYKGRSISHPRDYSIVGYDPETGEPVVPWLEESVYEQYRKSGLGVAEFLHALPEYDHQALSKIPSWEQAGLGMVGLDCRYLNFAPQCDGWQKLTRYGGSGSFMIEWSGLRKLTTAAAIPYFTGRYGDSPRGFGFVAIGANVDEFHKPAVTTALKIRETENRFIESIERQNAQNKSVIENSLQSTATRLTMYTAVMVLAVIAIAVLMASALTGRITAMIKGISKFRQGEMGYRLDIRSSDEMGALARSFNDMADRIQLVMTELEKSRMTAEDSNVSLRAMLSNIIDSMPSIVIGVDTEARVILWNMEAQMVTGLTFEEVDGKELFQVFPLLGQKADLVFSAIRQSRIKKEERLETIINGERFIYDLVAYPLIGSRIDGAVVRIDNVTTRVYMEDIVIQTEKMQSIGGLAAGMAHEINSPLAGIIQSAQVIRNRLKTDMPKNISAAREVGVDLDKVNLYFQNRQIHAMIQSILDAGRRAADIVANMLSFSRKSDSAFSHQNLGRLLDQTVDIIIRDFDLKKQQDFNKIRIIREYDGTLPDIHCDRGKIQQVFFNILKNGAQAMMNNNAGTQPVFRIVIRKEADDAVVEIEDNGPGMDEDVRSRIFDPFFTTKPVGQGTGLGLYISWFIIVENHGGTMSVASEPGRGTCFSIRLPLGRKT